MRQPLPYLRQYQARVLRSLLRGIAAMPGETFTVVFPRQSGKNEVSAALVSGLLRTHRTTPATVVVCAPTLYPQASISLDRTMRALVDTRGGVRRGEGRRDNVLRVGRASATFLSASPEAHVAGHTASLLLVADEAQDIDADWFNRQFRPMAASTGAATVMFGTPWNGESLLETAVRRNRRRQRGCLHPLHHEVHWRTVAKSVPRYGRYVRQERERLGAGHPLFVTQYELGTVHAAGRLFDNGQLARMQGTHEALDGPARGERYVMGLDFGGDGAGADSTVLVVARCAAERAEVVCIQSWTGAAYEGLLDELAALLLRWRPARVCADATGLGGPLVDDLQRRATASIERVVFTAGAKSELGYGLLTAASTGRLRLHRDDGGAVYRECLAQLRACSAARAGRDQLRWGNDRGHDDIVVALALCFRAFGATGSPRVAAGRKGG